MNPIKHLLIFFLGLGFVISAAHAAGIRDLRAANRAVCKSKFRVKDIEAEMTRLQKESPGANLDSLRKDRDSVGQSLLPQLKERDRLTKALKNENPEIPDKEACDKWGREHSDAANPDELKAAATQPSSVMAKLKTYLQTDRSSDAQINGNSGAGRGAAQVVPTGSGSSGTDKSGSGN